MSLPKTLYMKEEKDGDVTYFVASESVVTLAETDAVIVGTYQLSETSSVILSPVITPIKRKANK